MFNVVKRYRDSLLICPAHTIHLSLLFPGVCCLEYNKDKRRRKSLPMSYSWKCQKKGKTLFYLSSRHKVNIIRPDRSSILVDTNIVQHIFICFFNDRSCFWSSRCSAIALVDPTNVPQIKFPKVDRKNCL